MPTSFISCSGFNHQVLLICQKLQNRRFIHFAPTTRNPGTAHEIDREYWGGSHVGRRKACYNQGGNEAIEGGIIC